jgi:hypothetical protein
LQLLSCCPFHRSLQKGRRVKLPSGLVTLIFGSSAVRVEAGVWPNPKASSFPLMGVGGGASEMAAVIVALKALLSSECQWAKKAWRRSGPTSLGGSFFPFHAGSKMTLNMRSFAGSLQKELMVSDIAPKQLKFSKIPKIPPKISPGAAC